LEGLVSAAFLHRAKIAAWPGPRRAGWIAGLALVAVLPTSGQIVEAT